MKNVLNIVSKILKSIFLGSSDILPSIKDNLLHPNNGSGKFDWLRLSTYIIQLVLILAFVSGKLSIEQLKDLLKSF